MRFDYYFRGGIVPGVVRTLRALVPGATRNLDNLTISTSTIGGGLVGATASSLLGFWGVTPIVQPSGSAQAIVTTTAPITTGFGFSSAQATALLAHVAEIRRSLVAAGIIKGSS